MSVREFYQKALQFVKSLTEGDWITAAALAVELSTEFLPAKDAPRPMMGAINGESDDLTDDEAAALKATFKDAKVALKSPPRGAKAAVGGPWAIALVTVLGPLLLKKLEEWLKKRQPA